MSHSDPAAPFINDGYTLQQPAARPSGNRVQARLNAELAVIRTELGRMDNKTNMLLAVCSLLLGGAVTLLAGKAGALPLPVQVSGGLALGCVVGSLDLLLRTVRPNLRGNFGFRRWASADGGRGVLDELDREDATDVNLILAGEVHQLAALLDGKYRAVRTAVNLLITALLLADVAAVLALLLSMR